MAADSRVYKVLRSFKGLDLRTSDILRSDEYSTDMQNAQYRFTGATSKRKGHKYTSNLGTSGYGMSTFYNINTTTGIVTQELIGIDDNLNKLTSYTFNITYSGSSSASYLVYVKNSKFYFKITDGTTTVLDEDLGTGAEGSPVTISDLVTTIDALTDFSAGTISGSGTSPAAYVLPISSSETTINSGGGTSVTFEEWADVATPAGYSNPFGTFYGQRTSSDFENATFAQTNDVLYIATGHDELHKYDGTRVYRAGMPKASTPSAASSGADASSFPNNRVLRYKVVCRYTDAKGNVTDGEISDHVAVTTSGSGHSVNVTYTELAGSAGWDVDGTLQYLVYRTDDSADATDTSLYYLVNTADHGDTIPWKDTGVTEGAQYIAPVKTPGLPPKAKYVDIWRNQLLLSGSLTSADTQYYSDVTSPEHFPPADNSFIIPGKITGSRVLDNSLYIFQENNVNTVTGNLGEDNFQVDSASREGIGCVSHHSIQEVEGHLFFLSKRGIYRMSRHLTTPEHIGELLSPEFTKGNAFSFKRAVGYTWQDGDKYMLFMPVEPVDASYSNDTTNKIYVWDYYREAWLKWTNVNFMGGMAQKDGEIYFNSRTTSNVHCNKMSQTGTKYDYADHVSAIEFIDKSAWITLGEPSMWKKFLNIKVHSYDSTVNDFETEVHTLTVSQENDWETGTPIRIDVMDFSGGTTGWGNDPWGTFPWGQARLTQLKRKMSSKKVKAVRIIFENNNVYENVLISGYSIQVVAPYRNMMHE